MDESIEELLKVWALHYCPLILQDDDLFDALLHFISGVLGRERTAAIQRAVRTSAT